MKVIVEIPDKNALFAMKVLGTLSFVKKIKPMSDAAHQIWADLVEAAHDVNLHKQGKIKLKTAKQLLDEL
jgi:hypothetical protein